MTPLRLAWWAPWFASGFLAFGQTPHPEIMLTNQALHVRLAPPDATAGFYRGTRFDWSGVVTSLRFAGHEFYTRWFDRRDEQVADFVYAGDDIVAGPCTAVTGPVEEFLLLADDLAFDRVPPGGNFVKIGVGRLRRPDDRPYDPYRLYPIADGGRWTVTPSPAAVVFRHELGGPADDCAYDYHKTLKLDGDGPRFALVHSLRNTGRKPIRTSVYNHNFLFLDRQPPGPGVTLTFPFPVTPRDPTAESLARWEGKQVTFRRTLTGRDRVYLDLRGFGKTASDYDILIEHRDAGAAVRITSDRPLSRLAVWAIRAPLAVEPFIDLDIAPGETATWRIDYAYRRLSAASP